MGRKNDKRTRKSVAFFKVHYGFREPFKVLLDGNFIYASQQVKNQGLQDTLEKLLGANCKLFTTKCVTHELKSLGPDFRDSFLLAKKQLLHKCTHEQPISAADCILQQIGTSNPDHWWVATQDTVLRQTLAKVPGAPCITTTVHGTHLDPPSQEVRQGIKQAEEQQLSVPEHELKAVGRQARGPGMGKGIFKRNKAKGPNPLAVQKKKKLKVSAGSSKQQPAAAAGGNGDKAAAAAAEKKRRKRKKHVIQAADAADEDAGS